MDKKDYDSTIARMAGNMYGRVYQKTPDDDSDAAIEAAEDEAVTASVRIARKIIEEIRKGSKS